MKNWYLYISIVILILLIGFQFIISKPVYFNKNNEITHTFKTSDGTEVDVKWDIHYKSDLFFNTSKEFATEYSVSVINYFMSHYLTNELIKESKEDKLMYWFDVISTIYEAEYQKLINSYGIDFIIPKITLKIISVKIQSNQMPIILNQKNKKSSIIT